MHCMSSGFLKPTHVFKICAAALVHFWGAAFTGGAKCPFCSSSILDLRDHDLWTKQHNFVLSLLDFNFYAPQLQPL